MEFNFTNKVLNKDIDLILCYPNKKQIGYITEKYSLNVISLEEDDKLNENTISEVKKLIRDGQIKYIYSASETTNDTCKNLIDNYINKN